MKYSLIILFLLFNLFCFSQTKNKPANQGIIRYERSMDFSKLVQQLSYMSKEEKDRAAMTSGRWGKWVEIYDLIFTPAYSYYTETSKELAQSGRLYSDRKILYAIYRDFDHQRIQEWHEMLDKNYHLEDVMLKPKWKILNEIKEIQSFLCMKAETYDSIKQQKIVAWFTDAIPVSAGPEQSFGLPGMILELDVNDGTKIVTATEVNLSGESGLPTFPKKKFKKINLQKYNLLIADFISSSIKGQRNPYWQLRY